MARWNACEHLHLLLLSYIASLRQKDSFPGLRAELVNSVINWKQSPHSQSDTMGTQCSCEGMDEGFLTILKWITWLEEGLVACATVTGLQVVA